MISSRVTLHLRSASDKVHFMFFMNEVWMCEFHLVRRYSLPYENLNALRNCFLALNDAVRFAVHVRFAWFVTIELNATYDLEYIGCEVQWHSRLCCCQMSKNHHFASCSRALKKTLISTAPWLECLSCCMGHGLWEGAGLDGCVRREQQAIFNILDLVQLSKEYVFLWYLTIQS